MTEPLWVEDDALHWGGAVVPLAEVQALIERCDWRGRVWLEVRGPDWQVPIGEEYGGQRRMLRAALARIAWSADWSDGRFPHVWSGVSVVMLVTLMSLSATLAMAWGPLPAVAAGLLGAGAWASLLRQRVEVTAAGMRLGPAWAPVWRWEDIEQVHLEGTGPRSRVSVSGPRGAMRAAVPTALVPAVRARVWRLGALRLSTDAGDALDAWYLRRQAVMAATPWAVLAAGALAAVWTVEPWSTLTVALFAAAMLSAWVLAARERAQGWGSGALLYLTVAYGLLLGLFAIWGRGWV